MVAPTHLPRWAPVLFALGAMLTHCTRTTSAPRDAGGSNARSSTLVSDAAVHDDARTIALDPFANAVCRIDASMKTRLRELYRQGAARGLRADAFIKVGDSLTADPAFLLPLAGNSVEFGPFAPLEETLSFFRRAPVDLDGHNSFSRSSLAATPGWRALDPIAPIDGGSSPLVREINAVRPAFALLLLGSNDLARGDEESFAAGLTRVVDECLSRAVIPVLQTLPPRRDVREPARLERFNARIRALAVERTVPVLDLHAALTSLPDAGLGDDGVHLSCERGPDGGPRSADFRSEALRHGAPVQNLLALRALDALRRTVIADGQPDP